MHGIGDLDEAGNVGSSNQGWELALSGWDVLLGGSETVLESVLHDVLETAINLLRGPGQTLRVLSHLETGNGDTTGVGCLSWSVPDGISLLLLAVLLEDIDGLLGATHVGSLSDELAAVGDKVLSLLLGNLVLGGARKSDVNLDVGPWAGTLNVLVGAVLEGGETLALNLEGGNLLDILWGEVLELLGDQASSGVGHGDDGSTKLDTLESGVLGNVSGSGNGDSLALEGSLASVGNHVVNVVDETVSSGLWADERPTPGSSLSSENSLPLVAVGTVSTEQPPDLTSRNTNISSWDIGVCADVLAQLAHERDTELADLIIGLALWVEVSSSLATTNVHYDDRQLLVMEDAYHMRMRYRRATSWARSEILTAGKSVLEDLLETQELKDGKVDSWVETESSLVWAEGAVELNSVAVVDLWLKVVVLPDNTELDDTLWDGNDLKSSLVLWVLLEERRVLESGGEL